MLSSFIHTERGRCRHLGTPLGPYLDGYLSHRRARGFATATIVANLKWVHDLRHTFAVERVRQWYRDGKDVQSLLPRLVTYLGHRGLESTQLYLSITPSVLQEAAGRFELFAGACSHARGMKP